ncbi:glycogen debranching protein [Niveibacterium terrae]|uniref:glycogen debranching protein n=1 Tax=Niveibacterium terrae TaxID=3373598 RepID=UPI003A8D4AD7
MNAHFRRCFVCAALLILSFSAHPALDAQRLGARIDAQAGQISFRVAAARATRVELEIYAQAQDADEVASIPLAKGADGVWMASRPLAALRAVGVTGAVYYGYRAWGPNWPYDPAWKKGSLAGFISDVDAEGNRFNPNKLLLDPYAREISHDPLNARNLDAEIYTSGDKSRIRDSGRVASKAIVLADDPSSTGAKPVRPFKDDIVYEVHVRGLTMNDPSVPPELRGSYAGAALKAAYLASLGVTAVEFLPVQETQNDSNDVNAESTEGANYWGYMTLAFFAPDRRYAFDRSPGGPTREFKAMVRAFHDAGIKVLIDVVYNHTGEGGAWRSSDKTLYSIFSFRGLDNPGYYSLTTDKQYSWDNTGVGGNFNTHNPLAQDLIVDSLAWWRDELGVDGFRFDLAPVLGNSCEHACFNFDKMDPDNALNRIVRELAPRPVNGGPGVELIAEPWAIGGNSYQVGGFPAGWAEWNGIYRDRLRAAQNKLGVEPVPIGELATRLAGSSDLYGDDGRLPGHSVNFLVAHDGFTLKDLYSCSAKDNGQAWPYGPSNGGEDNNRSWDQGGSAFDQRQAARTGFALLMLSAGVPMIVGGDEFLRTLRCNNNPYNLDSQANWLNWSLTNDQANFFAFAQRLIAFRTAHLALHPLGFYSDSDNNGNGRPQLAWYSASGARADAAFWIDTTNHALAWALDGTELGDSASAIYVAYNGWSDRVDFTLPDPGAGRSWHRVTDTCSWNEGANSVAMPGNEAWLGGQGVRYGLCGRGVLLLIAK